LKTRKTNFKTPKKLCFYIEEISYHVMVNEQKLERMFNRLFLTPIQEKPRKDYRNAWRVSDESDLCEILEKMQWLNTPLHK